ncbi:C2H2 finger domain transcription factor dvrA [Erysiphe neolycopersici]|uniref:C2H2 finger domain transcription factor dvrA n=1 Tax=Erysiphe neolycopersici TaxID=212602 RepID=A0A420HN77_9PEZI|nr:C2H2 finger domain transcription factor dvrA [Erysiphe neolycopersici]
MDNPMCEKTFFKTESSPIPHSLSFQRSKMISKQEMSASHISEDIDMQGIITHDDATQIADKRAEKSSSSNNKKKKKGKVQIFYCSDFPPCNLSFTRSEHLARHIRKHTGERPFQCHCNRRFSRLDNLRQHAQSIHQNEEIPEDSLALISSRSQRQIRTDKVRVVGNRARSKTVGSQTGPIREHKRNSWSISSISSIGSSYSAGYVRERSLPNSQLIPTGDKLGLGRDTSGLLDSPVKKQPLSPIGLGTSPLTESILASPESNSWKSSPDPNYFGRVNSKQFQPPNRRLSFPLPHDDSSASSPDEKNGLYNINHESFSPASTQIKSSPTMTTSRIKNILSEKDTKTEQNNRRRTWHPDIRPSFNYATQQSNFSPINTQDPQIQLSTSPCNASPSINILRLPGIESFGPLHRPKTPPPHDFGYSSRDTPLQTLWRTQEHYRGQSTEEKERIVNINKNLLDLNCHQRSSSLTNEVLPFPHKDSILSSQIKDYTYKNTPESRGHDYSRPHIKIPPIMLPNEKYFDSRSNTIGSPIYSQMAELHVHSRSEAPINFSRNNNQVLPSFKDPTTEHRQSNLLSTHDMGILNHSDISRHDQFISRPFFSSTVPDRPSTLPYESTLQSQKYIQLNEKRNNNTPVTLRLDALVAAATR